MTQGIWLRASANSAISQAEVHAVHPEQMNSQPRRQQQYHKHRQRHSAGHASQQAQQQLRSEGQLLHYPWQPEMHTADYVHLLQQVALTQSWSGALRLLQQKHEMRQAHIGLLWWQLKPRLQARSKAAAAATLALADTCDNRRGVSLWQVRNSGGSTPNSKVVGLPQQRVQQVLHQLLELTVQHVSSLSPQSLAYTLHGLALAVAAGEVASGQPDMQQSQHTAGKGSSSSTDRSTAAPVLSLDLVQQLWARLLQVADHCTVQQLARCLTGGKLLGWHLCGHGSRSGFSSSTASLCCWPIVEAACTSGILQGLCAAKPTQKQQHSPVCCSSSEASELLAALALLMSPEQGLQPEQQVPQQQPAGSVIVGWHSQHPSVRKAVGRMLTVACRALVTATAAPAGTTTLGQGVRYTYDPSHGTVSTPASEIEPLLASSHKSVRDLHSATTAVSILHSAAVLGVQPQPWQLEQLIECIEPHMGCLAPQQLLQALQALLQLHVEPWESWLTACYSRLQVSIYQLDHHQLLQLLLILPLVRTVQPSQLLLHCLAKLTAVHCSRYSWDHLVLLPGALVELGYQPPPFWLKDYAAATKVQLRWQSEQQQRLQQQQQQQQSPTQQVEQQLLFLDHVQPQQQQQQQHDATARLQQCVEMLASVSRLGPTTPPSYWLSAMESEIIALHKLQGTLVGGHDHATGGDIRAHILESFARLRHQPKQELLQLLSRDVETSKRSSNSSSSCAPVQGTNMTQLDEQSQISCTMTIAGKHNSSRLDSCSSGDSSAESSLKQDCMADMLLCNSLQQQRQDEIIGDVFLPSWQLDLNCHLSVQLGTSQLGGAQRGMQYLIKKGWQLQRVCTTRGSRRLTNWGVSLCQGDEAVLALL